MENFTYEFEQTKNALETYEWDNIWWEKPNDTTGKQRFLLIGDSISCGYRSFVNKLLNNEYYADGLGTSKAIDNSSLPFLLNYMLQQENNCDTIHFNNGLHGWHLDDGAYAENYRKFVECLKKTDKRIIIALTTPVRKSGCLSKFDARNDIVKRRNDAAIKIAHDNNFEINDLYSLLESRPELYLKDGVHLTDEGYTLLSRQVVDFLVK